MHACTYAPHAQDVEDFGEAEGEFIGGPDPDEYVVGALEAAFDREALELPPEPAAGAQGPSQPQQLEGEPPLHPAGRDSAGTAADPASFPPLPYTFDAVQHGGTVGGAALAEIAAAEARERAAQAEGTPGDIGGDVVAGRAPPSEADAEAPHAEVRTTHTVRNLHASLEMLRRVSTKRLTGSCPRA